MNTQAMKYANVMQINGAPTDAGSKRLELGQHDALTLAKGRTLTCTSGLLWVTLENDVIDHILAEHESLPIEGRSKVVLSGLRPSSYLVA